MQKYFVEMIYGTIDFYCDVLFCLELLIFVIDENYSEYDFIYVTLVIASITFIVVPFIINLIQLHKELS